MIVSEQLNIIVKLFYMRPAPDGKVMEV